MDLGCALERGTFLFNAKTHSSTGFKQPSRVLYGRDANELRRVLAPKPHRRVNAQSALAQFVAQRAQQDRLTHTTALANDLKAKQQRNFETPTETGFQVGDLY